MTTVPLIPRKLLFGNPDKAFVQLSPDGAHLAWLAPKHGVLNVWVAPRDDLGTARPVTRDTGRGIRFYGWSFTNRHILYIQDKDGDENWRLFSVDLATDEAKDLTPFENVQAVITHVSHLLPDEVVIGLNKRDPRFHDLFRANVLTGELSLIEQNDTYFGFVVDDSYRPVLAIKMRPDGGMDIVKRALGGPWETWDSIPRDDALTTSPERVDKNATAVFMRESRGRNTAAVVAVDLATRETTLLAEDAQADAQDVLHHPTEKNVQAVSFVYERKRWQVLDPAIEGDLAYLRAVCHGDAEVVSRTLEDKLWVVAYVVDDGPVRFYLYDRERGDARFLFSNREALETQPLVKMRPAVIQARDGLELVAYYSLPPGSDSAGDGLPEEPVPMVLTPHGGPWGRDLWGFNPWHQWLANRGYAVLAVNFRSSTGFGKAFVNAGNKEWGGKIIEDQVDAVRWAIAKGIADPAKVAIMGGSFGGYSTLAGLTFTPELFACGVDLVGPSNLVTLLETVPPYWQPQIELFTTRVGDHRTEDGRALLKKHSPLTYVDRICRPLLIGQGANDPRVKQSESDQIVAAMQAKNIPVAYVLYPDEGHGFARPENNLSFNAVAEAFLARCLGGRCEPPGDDLEGSSLQVLAGVEEVPGLVEALAARPV